MFIVRVYPNLVLKSTQILVAGERHVQIVAVKLGIPTVNDEARGATATATGLLAPLDAQLGPINLELVQSLKSALTEQTDRTAMTVGEIVQQRLTLRPDVDAGLGLIAIPARVGHGDQSSLGDVQHISFLVHSHFIPQLGLKVNHKDINRLAWSGG